MQAKSPRISRQRRRELFRGFLPELLPPCRRCFPTLIECSCSSDSCACEIEIELVDPDTKGPCRCGWQDDHYVVLLASVLARLDPIHYGLRPRPSSPIVAVSSDVRIATMSARLAAGQSLYHPDDRNGSDGREGELIILKGNGVKKRVGVGHVEDSRHEARYSREDEKKIHRVFA